jgi:hypothetical protein
VPAIQFRRTLAANERNVDPLANWQYRYAPFNGLVRIGLHGTHAAAGADVSIFTGSQNVVEQSPISAGATDGVMPAPLNTPYFEFMAQSGDLISMRINELAGVATSDIMGFVAIDEV